MIFGILRELYSLITYFMNITIFLAQIWGPIILTVGLGIFLSHSFYIRIYRDLEKETLSVLLFGMLAMMLGIAHVQVHNLWDTLPQVVVSILGWGLLVKGIVFTALPKVADMGGKVVARFKLVSSAGIFMLLIGVYLSWFGYFV